MKNPVIFSVSCLLAIALAPPVLAAYSAGPGTADPPITILKVDCIANEPGVPVDCVAQGNDDVMIGEVEEIDYVNGTVLLNHRGARFTLHFPPAAIVDIEEGDTIAVPLGPIEKALH